MWGKIEVLQPHFPIDNILLHVEDISDKIAKLKSSFLALKL